MTTEVTVHKQSPAQEVVSLRDTAVWIMDRLDELSLSFDDPELKLALSRAQTKLRDVEVNLAVFTILEN